MKHIDVLTLFPGLFEPFLAEGVLGRALRGGLLAVEPVNFREHGLGRHRVVDDEPYGGGAGMLLRPEPVFAAVRERIARHREAGRTARTILLTPQGAPFRQDKARELAASEDALLLVCGRYEGFDDRIRQGLADEELSLGDFVLQGGEVAAMAVIEAVARLLPGVLGNPASHAEESFAEAGLEYPHFTRPPEFEGMRVPEVLCSGNHALIDAWRAEQAHARTAERRPELLRGTPESATGPRQRPGGTRS
ncbi:MAG TPA: tRNA (guanosine(37)-N1)-methyltransferase TrmD [bacterium]|nr:tRNA (guanosine(37)-N1)-methyltransferase TrmD [bacterium]